MGFTMDIIVKQNHDKSFFFWLLENVSSVHGRAFKLVAVWLAISLTLLYWCQF